MSQWLESVPAERKDAINAFRDVVNEHLPQGYNETVDWGMLAWVVPLARYQHWRTKRNPKKSNAKTKKAKR